MLITAGSTVSYNTMTASWGGVGVLWNRNICWCVVRPERYTYEFIEREDHFTLSFFDDEFRQILATCGSTSGRDIDKAAETGLIAVSGELPATTTFVQARLVLECRKLYFQDLNPDHFLDPTINDFYQNGGCHRMYMGEIVNCWVK
jgi:flavin reductase (DIM6/NTAB) family NADH-FMN oxidoreductase RutF